MLLVLLALADAFASFVSLICVCVSYHNRDRKSAVLSAMSMSALAYKSMCLLDMFLRYDYGWGFYRGGVLGHWGFERTNGFVPMVYISFIVAGAAMAVSFARKQNRAF